MSAAQKMSVIIATYNRAELLRDTLEALTKQTRPAEQVIVINNNSTDNTEDVAREFSQRLPLLYLFEPRQGVSVARNCGLKKATGDIIVFTDDDCIPDPDWLEYMERPFLRDPSIGLVGGRIVPRTAEQLNWPESFSAALHIMNEEAD